MADAPSELVKFEWNAYTPDGWSLKEIVTDNVNLAVEQLAREMKLYTGSNSTPGDLEMVWDDVVLDCGNLRDAFKTDLMDWGSEYGVHEDDAAIALAWAEYLESLAAEIRAAVQQAQTAQQKA